jgi:hypothetical protein
MVDRQYALQFLTALLATQMTELPLVWYLLSRHFAGKGEQVAAGKITTACLFANMATLPCLWFIYPEFFPYRMSVMLGEATAVFAEALFYMVLLGASLPAALLSSLVANVASVLVGLVVMPPFL